MKRYDSYKDSGVKWLGKIPSHWEVKRLRAAVTERKERFNSSESLMILSLLKDKGIIPYDEKGEVGNKSKDDHSQYKVARKGDLVINSMNVIIGSLGITPYDGYISPAYYSFRPNRDINLSYYSYILSLRKVQQSIRCFSKGIMEIRLKISAYDFLSMPFPFPNKEEQTAIANYLDAATSKIYEAIAQQQKMIDLLNERKQIIINNAVTKGLDPNVKMKPSGVDWIGDIPEHWNLKRLGYCSWIRARLGWKGLKANEYVDNGYPFLSAFNIQNNKLVWDNVNFINKQRYDESPEIKLNVGDILLVKDGAGIGKCARVDTMPLGEATANGSIAFITPYDGLFYKYLHYFIISPSFKRYTVLLLTGMGVPHFTQGEMKNVLIPIPTIDEQLKISEFLDDKLGKIDTVIDSYKRQISLLQERKQIIINDVVTGNVKVV